VGAKSDNHEYPSAAEPPPKEVEQKITKIRSRRFFASFAICENYFSRRTSCDLVRFCEAYQSRHWPTLKS
jgi:hypothetical protein